MSGSSPISGEPEPTPAMKCAVVGAPVAHSLSPAIHRAAFAELGLDWTYEAIQVAAGELPEFIDHLDRSQWRGLSVTMPHKDDAARVGRKSENVARTGVANTLVFDGDRIRAHNTDVTGFITALGAAGITHLRRAVVVGSGATARSAVVAATRMGASQVEIWCRTVARAEPLVALAREGGATASVLGLGQLAERFISGNPDGGAPADLVISTIPAGEGTYAGPIARAAPVVFDVIYDPWPTPVGVAAEESGHQILNGIDLLAAQALEQVELFTGGRISFEQARSAARDALNAR